LSGPGGEGRAAPLEPGPRARGGAGEPEHSLLSFRRRDSIAAAVLTLATAGVFVVMAFLGRLDAIQRLDQRWLDLMLHVRTGWLTWIAKAFNVLGLIWVTLPVRLAVAGFLAWKRRWYHFAAFVLAIVMSEVLIGIVKGLYDRPRPNVTPLVSTSGASFPSGHAVAASVTAVAIVIALFPEGKRRFVWGAGAALFSFVMALSRTYLAAHWLSDAMAGALLGTTVALDAALVVQEIWDLRIARGTGGVARASGGQ
jgi:membrane-associated phospholipid phosphatase